MSSLTIRYKIFEITAANRFFRFLLLSEIIKFLCSQIYGFSLCDFFPLFYMLKLFMITKSDSQLYFLQLQEISFLFNVSFHPIWSLYWYTMR